MPKNKEESGGRIYKVKNLTVAYEIAGIDKKSNIPNIHEFHKATNEIISITNWLTKHNISDFEIFIGALFNETIAYYERSYIEIVFNIEEDMVYFITGY